MRPIRTVRPIHNEVHVLWAPLLCEFRSPCELSIIDSAYKFHFIGSRCAGCDCCWSYNFVVCNANSQVVLSTSMTTSHWLACPPIFVWSFTNVTSLFEAILSAFKRNHLRASAVDHWVRAENFRCMNLQILEFRIHSKPWSKLCEKVSSLGVIRRAMDHKRCKTSSDSHLGVDSAANFSLLNVSATERLKDRQRSACNSGDNRCLIAIRAIWKATEERRRLREHSSYNSTEKGSEITEWSSRLLEFFHNF